MRKFLTILILSFVVSAANVLAQAPSYLAGEVTAINAAAKQMTLKTKDGDIIVGFDENSAFKRVSAEKPDFKTATASSVQEISQGDKLVAVVELAEDKKTVKKTRTVYLMTKGDIAKKQETEQARWTTRGVSGRVTAVNAAANEITVQLRGGASGGDATVVVAANDKTGFRRYVPNSVRYSEAVASNFGEVKVGDQLRATGEKSSDNARLAAEEIVFGSFRMVVGKIENINAAAREVTIRDAQTSKPIVIAVGDNTLLRRFPAEMAQRMAQMQTMRQSGQSLPNGAAGATPRQNAGQPGQSAANSQTPGDKPARGGENGGMMRGGARGDVDALLESMPALNLTELKIGDAVAASSSSSEMPDRVTAIKFVAGVEPFLNAPQIPQGGQQGNRPQSAPSFSIPGLDGIGAP